MMITVNLRPGLKRKRAGSPLAGALAGAKAFGARVKDPALLVAVAAWLGVAGWLGYTWVSNTTELRALEPHLEQSRAEHKRFKSFLDQKHKQEQIRDSLVTQITTIQGVDGDRYVWPHVLDEVTRALPAYTWLVDLSAAAAPPPPPVPAGQAKDAKKQPVDSTPRGLLFQLNGRTVDIQAYTRFLRNLEASPWITDVMPVSAQTIVEQERAVTAFTIRARFKQADSAYIRTVPLSQSVR
ncbi:MAG TPA: PilN domain-containing protein [Gemmatimonadales bacterium]|jgi:Tfp pilus assembly protein PilN|nr:PilN domain-containing protein [Gemmatimonadales bacterium]